MIWLSLRARLVQSWFLVGLVLVLVGGGTTGWQLTSGGTAPTLNGIHPGRMTMVMLFLMSYNLDSQKLRQAFAMPRPVLWGSLLNLGLVPLLAWPLLSWIPSLDFRVGLMITAATPCTLATASVATRLAGGNDAISLLVTLLTNLLSIVLSPLWLKWTLAIDGDLDPGPIIANLAVNVLIPTVLGQAARIGAVPRRFADRYRAQISIVAQCLVLLVVLKAAVEAGGQLRLHTAWPSRLEVAGLAAACLGLHVAAIVLAEWGGRLMQIELAERIAVVFAGSQKTMPIALLLAALPAVTGDTPLPLVTIPIVIFHSIQLVLDTAIASRIRQATETNR